jgi:uncharacterized membrane protein (UPF0127 family)
MSRRALVIAGLAIIAAAVVAVAKPAVPPWRDAHPWTTRKATVVVGEIVLEAEIADTPALQRRGLGYRDALEPGTAMLFQFPDPGVRSFWMKGMRFCLDIIWIADDRIVGAAEKVCPMPEAADGDLPRYSSGEEVSYVLEVPAGWMELNDFGPGTEVEIRLPEDQES